MDRGEEIALISAAQAALRAEDRLVAAYLPVFDALKGRAAAEQLIRSVILRHNQHDGTRLAETLLSIAQRDGDWLLPARVKAPALDPAVERALIVDAQRAKAPLDRLRTEHYQWTRSRLRWLETGRRDGEDPEGDAIAAIDAAVRQFNPGRGARLRTFLENGPLRDEAKKVRDRPPEDDYSKCEGAIDLRARGLPEQRTGGRGWTSGGFGTPSSATDPREYQARVRRMPRELAPAHFWSQRVWSVVNRLRDDARIIARERWERWPPASEEELARRLRKTRQAVSKQLLALRAKLREADCHVILDDNQPTELRDVEPGLPGTEPIYDTELGKIEMT
jgi:hypothetical protein